MIAVNTNVIAYLFIKGDYTQSAENLLKLDSEWVAPLLWRSEFRSVISTYLKKEYLSLDVAINIAELAEEFMAGREFQIESDSVLELVSRSKCSAYDCEFIALAQTLGTYLYTSDQLMLSEFPKITKSLRELN